MVKEVKYPSRIASYTTGTKTTAIPGCLFTSKTSEVSQKPSTNLAFDGFGMTYQSLLDNFGCNSLNNKRANIVGTVRYAYQYMNAIWDGVQMKFSGRDGTVFINFTDSINLVAHEWTHGLFYNTCRLGYLKQARVHNKSLANFMSRIVKQLYYNKTAADATWLMEVGDPQVLQNVCSLRAPSTAYSNAYVEKDPPISARKELREHRVKESGSAHQLRHRKQGLLQCYYSPGK